MTRSCSFGITNLYLHRNETNATSYPLHSERNN
jgi:hypothetical protein